MSGFSIRNPYLIVVLCLVVMILGTVSVGDMPVDMFPSVDLPVVAVATFYSGMPPQQIETNITYHLERPFTLAAGIDHMESLSCWRFLRTSSESSLLYCFGEQH